jgi:hypothetical protein
MIARNVVLAVVALGGDARADEVSPWTPAATAETTDETTAEPTWLFYVALRNDAISELEPPFDDVGFTHDNVLAIRREDGALTLGGSFVQRWLTSSEDRRRWDLVELFATGERAWSLPIGVPHEVATSVRVGPAFGGNFGGRYLQNGWHALTKSGPTLEQGLANDYPGHRTLGIVAGGRTRAVVGERVQGYAFVDGQAALGDTGVSSLEIAGGGAAASTHVGAHVELAVTRYHVGDAYLALPGAYRTGFQLELRVGVAVMWSRFRVGYEYRANESGSGEPVGVLEFSSRR